MIRVIIQEVRLIPGKKPTVIHCYQQDFPEISVLELVAKINAPAKVPRTRAKKEVDK